MKHEDARNIERYLRGLLSEDERKDLEQKLAADPALQHALQHALQLQAAEIEVMQQVTAVRVAEKIKHWQHQKKKRERAFGLAGAGLAVLLLGWFFGKKDGPPAPSPAQMPIARDTVFRAIPKQQQPNSPAPQRDFSEKKAAAAPLPPKAVAEALKLADPPVFRRKLLSGETAALRRDSLLAEAEKTWSNADFARTLAQIDALAAQFPESSNRWLRLRGTVLLRDGQATAAAAVFEKIPLATPECLQADWNLLLAYLATGQPGRADFEKLWREILADKTHPAHAKARDLQKKIAPADAKH